MSIVICEKVSKIYQQDKVPVIALDDVDLRVEAGTFVSLAGPSGCGKTTLLNIIGGLDQPTSGAVTVGAERLDTLNKAALADLRLHKIGFIFQAYNLIPVLTAQENVEFIMQLRGVAKPERKARAESILASVGLADQLHRRPGELSGGQQQRVAVARAMVSEPGIVLADEPTANLDSSTSDDLLGLMRTLNENSNTTFIVATHDPRVIAFTDRKVSLLDGQIIADH
ncbi:MAG: ABC transporter ATP-binding protein [Pontibacterium sp.]